jgi:hypothetical protein
MKFSLKFVVSYSRLEPLLELLFIYFDHEIFHFCPCLSVALCKQGSFWYKEVSHKNT